jgi:disulfide bond formation protein DsbB
MIFPLLALLAAIATAAGSLYLTLEMGHKTCTLCFYQRAFAFALVGVLATGMMALRERPARVCLLALPVALGGFGVAAFTSYLGMTDWPRQNENWYLACPIGIEGYGTSSQQSMAAFGVAFLILLIGAVGEVKVSGHGGMSLIVGLLLGAGAAYGSIVANPPMEAPKPAQAGALDECRPTLR